MSLDNTQKPWLPERDVSESQARRMLDQRLQREPSLAQALGRVQRVRFLSNGWDNSVFVVETEKRTFTARFPRRQIALSLLENEAAILPFLAPNLPAELPQTLALLSPQNTPGSDAEWPILLSKFVQGTTLCRASLSQPQRFGVAMATAKFLRALHDTPLPAARRHGAQNDVHRRTDFQRLSVVANERVGPLVNKNELHKAEGSRLLELIKSAQKHPPADAVLCHGDLYARHLIVHSDDEALAPSLRGVIDWGDIHIGCPSKDLGILATLCLGDEQALEKALSWYGALSSSTKQRALACALYSALMILSFGLDVNDEALVAEGRKVLKALLN